MIIAKELPIGKQDSNTCIATSSLGVGNIVPHWWYKEIRATGDKPDLVAITILSELYFLYRKTMVQNSMMGIHILSGSLILLVLN